MTLQPRSGALKFFRIAVSALEGKSPLPGKGGVDAPSRKCVLPLKGADGVVRSSRRREATALMVAGHAQQGALRGNL